MYMMNWEKKDKSEGERPDGGVAKQDKNEKEENGEKPDDLD